MARYMDVHHGFEGVTAEQLAEAHQADLDIEGAEGVHFESAWLDPELDGLLPVDRPLQGGDHARPREGWASRHGGLRAHRRGLMLT